MPRRPTMQSNLAFPETSIPASFTWEPPEIFIFTFNNCCLLICFLHLVLDFSARFIVIFKLMLLFSKRFRAGEMRNSHGGEGSERNHRSPQPSRGEKAPRWRKGGLFVGCLLWRNLSCLFSCQMLWKCSFYVPSSMQDLWYFIADVKRRFLSGGEWNFSL